MALTGLLLLFFVCVVNAKAGSGSQPPLLDLLSGAVEGVTPCMLPCLLRNISATWQALLPCGNQTVTDFIQFVEDNDIQDYNDLYDKAIVKTDDRPSAFCRFFDESTSCLEGAVSGLCGNGTAAHLQALLGGIQSYANCQGDLLPVLQCAVHPDMFKPGSGYMECVEELVEEVNERYLHDGIFYWYDFYHQAILANNGIGARRLLTNFGSCLDTEITLVTDCGRMRGYVLPQIEAIRNFLDVHHDKGTDALICFGKPILHSVYTRCTKRLLEDITTPKSAVVETWVRQLTEYLGDVTLNAKAVRLFTEHLSDGILDNVWQEILLLARTYYLSYTTCLRSVTEQQCGYHWSAQEIIKITKPTDDFFTGLRPPVIGPDCGPVEGPDEPSGGARQVPLWHMYTVLLITMYMLQ